MEMQFGDEGKCKVEIHAADGFVTVRLTELSEDLLKRKYEVVATKVYREQLNDKVDPLSVVWLGYLPKDSGYFEILMPWHGDAEGYGSPQWYKRKSAS